MLALFGLLAGALTSSGCTVDSQGYCTDKVVRQTIQYDPKAPSIRINCALGDVVAIFLPDGVQLRGEPALGNRAIFDVRAQTDVGPFRILVWPKYPANAQNVTSKALEGERSNLQVFLDSGVTINVELKVGAPDKAVQQLKLEFPERAQESEYVREEMEQYARRVDEQYQERERAMETNIEERARRRLARSLIDRLQCEDLGERAMSELLVLRARRICRIGDLTFIQFSIHNRARDLFRLSKVEVAVAGNEEGEGAIAALVEFGGGTTLAFDQEVQGAAVFSVAENAAREYAVTVREDGGKKRVVTVDDVEF